MAEFLVVGLGNPGEEYEDSPHNLGFLVIDKLAAENAIRVTRKENMALVGLGRVAGKEAALAKPQTYMNLSGGSVKGLMERYGLGLDRLVVVYDELDLPWGSLRIRKSGSAAGHNGVKSLIGSLGSNEFCRLRLGVNPGRPIGDGVKFLLSPMKRGKNEVEEAVSRAAEAVEAILAGGAEQAMAKYNRRAPGLNTGDE